MSAQEIERSWTGLENALRSQMTLPAEKRCTTSDLFVSQCAHCRGDHPWWEPEGFVKSKVVYQ